MLVYPMYKREKTVKLRRYLSVFVYDIETKLN